MTNLHTSLSADTLTTADPSLTSVQPATADERNPASEAAAVAAAEPRAAGEQPGIAHALPCGCGALLAITRVMASELNLPAESYQEPWRPAGADQAASEADFTDAVLLDAAGEVVVDMYGATLIEDEEARYLRRIAACVNFCRGLPTEALERCVAEWAAVNANAEVAL